MKQTIGPTDVTEPPPDPKINEPRLRLLLAAESVFARKGFDGATVRDICDLAGMNVAAINYHFGDKERLYIETVRHATRAVSRTPDRCRTTPGCPRPSDCGRSSPGCCGVWTPRSGPSRCNCSCAS